MQDYALTLMAIIVGGLVCVIIWLSSVVDSKRKTPMKEEPFKTRVKRSGPEENDLD
ncbi:hypothetical protein L0156_28035 [bacterium]|nr:hypothetical protein [bacterium]